MIEKGSFFDQEAERGLIFLGDRVVENWMIVHERYLTDLEEVKMELLGVRGGGGPSSDRCQAAEYFALQIIEEKFMGVVVLRSVQGKVVRKSDFGDFELTVEKVRGKASESLIRLKREGCEGKEEEEEMRLAIALLS